MYFTILLFVLFSFFNRKRFFISLIVLSSLYFLSESGKLFNAPKTLFKFKF